VILDPPSSNLCCLLGSPRPNEGEGLGGEGRGEGGGHKLEAMERSKELTENARQLRHSDTLAEKLAWKVLRSRQVLRYKFRRQHPIGNTIVDFCCLPLRLVVELDGSIHAQPSNVPRDVRRQRYLEDLGYRVARFSNGTVLKAPEEFTSKVKELIAQLEDLRVLKRTKHPQSIRR
jgi:very-short-patch-repair endonuclease